MKAMNDAIIDGNIAKVRLLLKAGVPASGETDGFPFLCLAAMLVKEDIFTLLLANGAAATTPRLLDWAVDGGGGRLEPSLAIVQRILKDVPHDREALTAALRFACVSGNVDVVRLLLQMGADPNGRDELHNACPLSNAIRRGHADVVNVLLDEGADATQTVFAENDVGDLTGDELTLVDLAVQEGYPDIAKLVG
jgi:ankyrin repeat protein